MGLIGVTPASNYKAITAKQRMSEEMKKKINNKNKIMATLFLNDRFSRDVVASNITNNFRMVSIYFSDFAVLWRERQCLPRSRFYPCLEMLHASKRERGQRVHYLFLFSKLTLVKRNTKSSSTSFYF